MKKFLLIFKSIPWILVVSVSIVVGSLGQVASNFDVRSLILALFGLIGAIGVAQLIDRLSVLNNVEENTSSTKKYLESLNSMIEKINRNTSHTKNYIERFNIEGLKKFNQDRVDLGPFEPRLQKANHEIFIMGGALQNSMSKHKELLFEKAESGCKVRLLLMNPLNNDHLNSDNDANQLAVRMSDYYGSYDHCASIKRTLDNFFYNFDKASETAKRNLEVRVYDCAQTLSMSIFDHHEQMKTGSMIVEFLIYGTTKIHLRPSLEFAQQHKAYETFHKSIAINLWNNSKPWPLYQISNQNK